MTEVKLNRNKSGIVAGVDIGSTASKALLMKNEEIISIVIGPSSVNPARTAQEVFRKACDKANINQENVEYIVGTGYGRAKVNFANENVSEISCHGMGAAFLMPSVRTVIDIGGQDCKAISLDDSGMLKNFAMNDKCAAGTGRFLEMMARILELEVKDLGNIDALSESPVSISNVCSVFAESEVINLVNEDRNISDIVRGLHISLTNRVAVLVNRVGLKEDLIATGGVAKNSGVRRALSEKIGADIKETPDGIDPQIIGALGAAVISERKLEKLRSGCVSN